jgi:methanogenic corrinoid protein MtbC1
MEPINIQTSRAIDAERARLAETITDLQYRAHPELLARYGPAGREKCLQDAGYHLAYLSEAIAADNPDLFADYIAWAKVMLAGRGIPSEDLAANLRFLRQSIRDVLPEELSAPACAIVENGIGQLPDLPDEIPTDIHESAGDGSALASLAHDYLAALLRGERHAASRMVLDAVASGTGLRDIYLGVFQRSQHEIGRLWQMNRISIAQEHYCTAATQLIMSQLYPYIFSTERKGLTMVATCIGGDLHEIGVRMISDFFEMEGWDTIYLGANTPTASVVRMLIDRKADLLAVSATMGFHVRGVTELIRAVRANEACSRVKILVGGYPFNLAPDLWRQTGADAFARDAADSVAIAEALIGGRAR